MIRDIRNTHLKEGNSAVTPLYILEFCNLPEELTPKAKILVDPSLAPSSDCIRNLKFEQIPHGLDDFIGMPEITVESNEDPKKIYIHT